MSCGPAEFVTSPCMYTKHRCRLRKDLQLPLTLKGSKEDLQFIRILPHPSSHFMYLFNVLVPFPYVRVPDILLHVEACKRHLLRGWFWLMFLDPTLWTLVSSTRSVAHITFFSNPQNVQVSSCSSYAVKWSMSIHIALYQLEMWSGVLKDTGGGSCCVVFAILWRDVQWENFHRSNSFSKCFSLNSSEKSSCISWTKKEFGAGQGKMQYAHKCFGEVKSSMSYVLGML